MVFILGTHLRRIREEQLLVNQTLEQPDLQRLKGSVSLGEVCRLQKQLENQTLVKQGEQIFIPDNVPHAPYNLSDKKCVWVVVHSSGDDQDELIRTEELDYVLESYEQREP